MNGEEVKTAILNRNFTLAQELFEEWGTRVKQLIKLASGNQERKEIYERARLFAETNLLLTRVIRAQIASERSTLSAWVQYSDFDLEQHRWQIRA